MGASRWWPAVPILPEAEGGAQVSEPCQFCQGDGWHSETEHNPACTGDKCVEPCPVEVQVICRHCEGSGYAEGSGE